MATSTGVCFHPSRSIAHWYLLLPGVAEVNFCFLVSLLQLLTGFRWLMSKRRHLEAYKSLLRFRGSQIQAARELYYVYAQMQAEEILIAESGVAVRANFFTRFIELFTIPRIRRATQASGIVMIAQQMCGSKFCTAQSHGKGPSNP
jgi:hypothetical protein